MYINHFFNYSACPQLIIAPFENLVISANLEACRLLRRDTNVLEKTALSDLFGTSLPEFLTFTQTLIDKGRGWCNQLRIDNGEKALRIEIHGQHSTVRQQTLLHLTFNPADELDKLRHRASADRAAGYDNHALPTDAEVLHELQHEIANNWPSNLRELHNLVEHVELFIRAKKRATGKTDNRPAIRPVDRQEEILTTAELRERERRNMIRALQRSQGRIFGPGGAAELIDIKPTTLASKLKRYQIDRRQFKQRQHAVA